MTVDKKKTQINKLFQYAEEIINNGMVVIDDHIQGLRTIDHLVLVETPEGVFLCPVIDDDLLCCLNLIRKDEDGYHWTYFNVAGNVWNKDRRKNICDRCADYNAEPKNYGKIIAVMC